MLSENELIITSDNILLVLGVLFVERFNKFGFNESLLVQPLFVLKDF